MIFFDLDDTLIETKKSESIGIRSLYNKYKNEIQGDEDTFMKHWGEAFERHFNRFLRRELTYDEQWIERIKDLFSHSGINLSKEEAEIRSKYYMDAYKQSWRPFDDTLPCLKELNGHKLGLVTNGDLKLQSLKLEKMGLKDFFSVIVISDEAGVAKPDLRIFELACKRAKVSPKDCFFVGDNPGLDVYPSIKAGMHSVWINRYNKEIERGDFYTIKSLNELKGIIDNHR